MVFGCNFFCFKFAEHQSWPLPLKKKIEVICSDENVWWREHEKCDIHQFTSDIRLKWENKRECPFYFFTRLYRFRWLGSNILWMKLLLTFWLDIIALFHDCPGEGVILKFAPKSWTFRPEPVLVDDLTGEDSLFSSDTRFFALRQKKGLPVKKQKVGSI